MVDDMVADMVDMVDNKVDDMMDDMVDNMVAKKSHLPRKWFFLASGQGGGQIIKCLVYWTQKTFSQVTTAQSSIGKYCSYLHWFQLKWMQNKNLWNKTENFQYHVQYIAACY